MEQFMDLLVQPLREFGIKLAALVPNLLAMLIIIFLGLVIARVAQAVFRRIARALDLNAWSDRAGLTALIRKVDIWTQPADVFGSLLYGGLVLLFVLIGLRTLRLEAVNQLISQFFLYLPRLLTALLILVIGYIIAGFLSRAVLITAVNNGVHYARFLAEGVRLLLVVLILAMSLELLGIAPRIVVAAFSIVFGGIVLALAIAFGAGGIETARKIIERSSSERKEEETERKMEHL